MPPMYKTLITVSLVLGYAGWASAVPLVVDSEKSGVAVDVKASPPHHFTCDLLRYNADIDLEPLSGTVNSAVLTFELTDLDTHNEKRDRKMYGWMDVEQHNTIRWTLDSVEKVDGQLVAHGQMEMHGVNRPVDVPFEVSQENGIWTISGVADFDYMDFDLPRIRLFVFTVNPGLHVHFNLQGSVASAQ